MKTTRPMIRTMAAAAAIALLASSATVALAAGARIFVIGGKGEKSREEITDLMAGGEQMAALEAEIQGGVATRDNVSQAAGA